MRAQGAASGLEAWDSKHRDPNLDQRHRESAIAFEWVLKAMLDDLKLRGLKPDRRRTFDARLRACFYLLLRAEAPDFRVQEWSAKRPYDLPARVRSDEQATVISKCSKA